MFHISIRKKKLSKEEQKLLALSEIKSLTLVLCSKATSLKTLSGNDADLTKLANWLYSMFYGINENIPQSAPPTIISQPKVKNKITTLMSFILDFFRKRAMRSAS